MKASFTRVALANTLQNQVKGHFNKETQHDARIAPAEVNNDTTMAMGDAQVRNYATPFP